MPRGHLPTDRTSESAGPVSGSARKGPPILHLAEPRAASPLPGVVPLLAALGLAVLCLCTLPAVNAQQRLEKRRARLAHQTHEAARVVEGLHRELRDGAAQTYLRTKATRALLHSGATYLQRRDRCLEKQRAPTLPVPRPGGKPPASDRPQPGTRAARPGRP